MTNHVIKSLLEIWNGPPLKVKLNEEVFEIGKGHPQTTVHIKKPTIVSSLLTSPSLTFGEAYTKGDIEIEGDLADVLRGFYLTEGLFDSRLGKPHSTRRIGSKKAVANAKHHYDIGNDFYKLWLDKNMVYSCAYFLNKNDSLTKAQEQKLELVCRKARLQKGQSLFDIGCGWGSLLFHAAENYDATVTGIVAAQEQANYIEAEAQKRGLADKVNVIRGDWREATGTYDRVFSVGVAEHVGEHQLEQYYKKYYDLMTDDGIALLHTIGRISTTRDNPWINKYIFPGGYLPTLEELSRHASVNNFITTDIENLWQHYAITLSHWSKNFQKVRDQVVDLYDEEFARMWWLYLQGSQTGFEVGGLQLWQQVLIKNKQASWPLNREVGLVSR